VDSLWISLLNGTKQTLTPTKTTQPVDNFVDNSGQPINLFTIYAQSVDNLWMNCG